MITRITLHPSRIGCPSLPATMKGIVSSLPGVKEVTVRYEERSLDVVYDNEKLLPGDIIRVIGKELGLSMEAGEEGGKKEGHAAETCPM